MGGAVTFPQSYYGMANIFSEDFVLMVWFRLLRTRINYGDQSLQDPKENSQGEVWILAYLSIEVAPSLLNKWPYPTDYVLETSTFVTSISVLDNSLT
jgi:hypothetical protein